jgi:hypothetical protein
MFHTAAHSHALVALQIRLFLAGESAMGLTNQ